MKNKYPVNIFQSDFKMKGDLNISQKNIISFWRNKKRIKKKFFFTLHDGPPFANGKIHLGHILNKILKDIIIKYKNILNYECPYILGWDCFGLPIEKKFKEKNYKNKIYKYKLIKKYILIKNYIEKVIKKQKIDFNKIGILNNYNNFYKTINYRNSSEEIRILYNFNKKKYFYKKYKIMNWCYKCKSFLSNSEIFFYKKIDFSIIIIFLFSKIFFFFNNIKLKKKYIIGGILIWTTLPWTILSNQGLCINNEKIYIIINTIKGNFIINLQKYIYFKKNINFKLYIYKIFFGYKIINSYFINPLFKINKYFFKKINIFKNKKIKNLGTEILHISPNHGLEDYKIYKKYKKNKIINLFNINGNFKINNIFFKKNINYIIKYIINYLIKNNKYFFFKKYEHKYMFCKKDFNYIIYKIIEQWYIKFKKKIFYKSIKNKINEIFFLNKKSKKKFINTLKKKPEWNIYRQRFWGIPTAKIFDKKKNINYLFKFFSNHYEIYGIKYWYIFSKLDLYKTFFVYYKKLYNVLDVWFDSGTTHWHVVRSSHKNILKFPSDLYLEGEDQYRGWFQSSFITSVLLNKKIPFKCIISHNFIKTIYGEKLSKTLNNYVDYKYLTDLLGIDLLRLLLCNIKYNKNIILNKNLLNNTIDIYRKIRNCLRFFLTNISNFNFKKKIYNLNINKYIITYFNIKIKKILKLYNKYNFKKILIKLKNFLSEDLSSFYFDIMKNYLYLNIINSNKRKSTQLTLFWLLKKILIIFYPIIPFTTEEAWNKLFFKKTILNNIIFLFKNNKKIYKNYWIIIKYIKFFFYKKIEIILNIKNLYNLELKVYLFINNYLYKILKKNKIYLKYLFSISYLYVNLYKKNKIFFFYKFYKKNKCLRCWIKKKMFKQEICKTCFLNLYKQSLINNLPATGIEPITL